MQGQGWLEGLAYEYTDGRISSTANHFRNAAPEDIPYGKKSGHISILIGMLRSYPRSLQDTSMRPSVFTVFWRYVSQIVTTSLGQVKGNTALRTQKHLAGERSITLDVKSVFNSPFVPRVRVHKYTGMDNLDAWPAVKVSKPDN